MERIMKFIYYTIIWGLYITMTSTWADEIVYIGETSRETLVTSNIDYSGISRAVAAGQHHYKATSQLQWSVGAGFAGNESALSLGFGLQTGKIFVSGNVTDTIFSNEGSPVVGLGVSGTF